MLRCPSVNSLSLIQVSSIGAPLPLQAVAPSPLNSLRSVSPLMFRRSVALIQLGRGRTLLRRVRPCPGWGSLALSRFMGSRWSPKKRESAPATRKQDWSLRSSLARPAPFSGAPLPPNPRAFGLQPSRPLHGSLRCALLTGALLRARPPGLPLCSPLEMYAGGCASRVPPSSAGGFPEPPPACGCGGWRIPLPLPFYMFCCSLALRPSGAWRSGAATRGSSASRSVPGGAPAGGALFPLPAPDGAERWRSLRSRLV